VTYAGIAKVCLFSPKSVNKLKNTQLSKECLSDQCFVYGIHNWVLSTAACIAKIIIIQGPNEGTTQSF
jgi:hypothetical protein